MAIAGELRLELLGGLSITQGGAALPGLASHKGQALLAYLAFTHKTHTRDALAGLFWGDFSQEEARTSLRAVLSQLRKVATPHLIITRDTISFNFDSPYRLDVEEFLAEVRGDPSAQPRAEGSLRKAMELYGGEFLDGFYVLQAPAFDEWMVGQRQWLHGLAVDALHRLAAQSVIEGDAQLATGYLGRLLVLEPWREEAHREMMRLMAESGQRSAALAQYASCRRILLSELGVEPSEETTSLYEEILSRKIPGAKLKVLSSELKVITQNSELRTQNSVVSHNLPAPLTPLIGRDVELYQLADRLNRSGLRLMTLVGTAGIGKTRLALELASRMRPTPKGTPYFPDGVFLVSLASLAQPDLVPAAIAQVLDVHEGSGTSYLDGLKQWLGGRRVLLVLDNFEHLLNGSSVVSTLLEAAPELKVLVTSREPLNLYGEHQYPLLPLAVPDPGHLPPLASLKEYPSVALFCARAEAVKPDFELTERNASSVVEICHRLDGSPLAIELAAAQVKGLRVEEIAKRLDERFRLLRVGSRNIPERHQTLRASIDWSYDLLLPEHRRLLRYLSVFAGGWTLEAAESVCADERLPREDVSEGMLRLVDKSLMVPSPGSDNVRYGMHETIREYAREKLEEEHETDDLRARHLQYFTALAEAAEPQLRGPDQLRWLEQLDTEHDNIRAALDRALNPALGLSGLRPATTGELAMPSLNGRSLNAAAPEGTPYDGLPDGSEERLEQALRLSGALWRFWLTRGYLAEGLRRLEAALRSSESMPDDRSPTDEGRPTTHPQSAIRAHLSRKAPVRNPQLRRPLLVAMSKALAGAGVLAHGSGNYPASLSYLEQNLAVRRALGDKQAIASALQNLGAVTKFQDLARARMLVEESLALKRELGDKMGIANSLATLGAIACEQADYIAARRLYDESMALHRETGDLQGLTNGLNHLGSLLLETGDLSGARTLYQESVSIARKLGDKSALAAALGNMGRVAADQEDYTVALTLQKESLEEYRRAGFLKDVCENFHDMALVAGALGQAQEAVRLLGAAHAARLATDYRLTPVEQARNDRGLAKLHCQIRMEPHDWETAYAEGLAMSMEQAIEYAMHLVPAGSDETAVTRRQ